MYLIYCLSWRAISLNFDINRSLTFSKGLYVRYNIFDSFLYLNFDINRSLCHSKGLYIRYTIYWLAISLNFDTNKSFCLSKGLTISWLTTHLNVDMNRTLFCIFFHYVFKLYAFYNFTDDEYFLFLFIINI